MNPAEELVELPNGAKVSRTSAVSVLAKVSADIGQAAMHLVEMADWAKLPEGNDFWSAVHDDMLSGRQREDAIAIISDWLTPHSDSDATHLGGFPELDAVWCAGVRVRRRPATE